MNIRFESMKKEEFKDWSEGSRQRFAADKMKFNNLTKQEADKIATDIFNKILAKGFNTRDNFFYFVKSDESELVGYIWYCIRGADNNQKAWVCDIMIEESFRRYGLGRKTMLFLEQEVKKKNINHIGLHVFAQNKFAVKLYESLGYMITDLSMEKTI